MKVGLRLALVTAVAVLGLLGAGAEAHHLEGCTGHTSLNPCDPQTVPEEKKAPSNVGEAKAIPKAPTITEPGFVESIGIFVGDVGKEMGKGADAVGGAVASTFLGIGALVVGALRGLAEALVQVKPRQVDSTTYAAMAGGAVGAAALGAQVGAAWAWKKLFPLGLGGLGLFSRIDKDELLENDRRARIFELIKSNPGIHLSEIARELDFAWGTTLHHLRKLRADRLILYKEMGHHKSFFVNGSGLSEKQMEAMSLIKNGTLSRLAQYLENHPRVSLKELSEALQISPPLAAFHIRKLEKAGLVQKVRDGKSVRLSTTQALPAGFLQTLGVPEGGVVPDAAS